jgi:hypothetical protein
VVTFRNRRARNIEPGGDWIVIAGKGRAGQEGRRVGSAGGGWGDIADTCSWTSRLRGALSIQSRIDDGAGPGQRMSALANGADYDGEDKGHKQGWICSWQSKDVRTKDCDKGVA